MSCSLQKNIVHIEGRNSKKVKIVESLEPSFYQTICTQKIFLTKYMSAFLLCIDKWGYLL